MEEDNAYSDTSKVFNDPIHGHIEFPPLCVAIIDTPQFQRLRYLKQVGAVYFVFPGASHNRFEHSLGVGHLAGELVRKLRERQPSLNITDVDVLCVEVAGLCHDLGHGAFSHMFDSRFIPQCGVKDWKHEKASVDMFDHLIKENSIDYTLYGLTDQDITFIKEQIAGPLDSNTSGEWQYKGRSEEKSFLYEIVANKRNGIDVDKWDYFARDCHHLGIRNIFDHRRFMQFARVINVDGKKQICSRDKEVGNVYDMFYTRNVLHRRAYQHKNCIIIEYMLTEALLLANDFLTFPGIDKNGATVQYKLSDTIQNMYAYTLVNDSVYHLIRLSQDVNLAPARAILDQIERRQLYKCVGQSKPNDPTKRLKPNEDEREIELAIVALSVPENKLNNNDVIVQFCRYDYGKGDKNPINDVRFYSKGNPVKTFQFRRDDVSRMTPEVFREEYVRVYSRYREKIDVVSQCFKLFCLQNDYIEPKGGDPGTVGLTPYKVDGENGSQSGSEFGSTQNDCKSNLANGKKRKLEFDS